MKAGYIGFVRVLVISSLFGKSLHAKLTAYNKVNQPVPNSSVNFWLLGLRLDITFTRNLYLATLVQYNSQRENLNINARFQWRYAPVSDFYLVYTDDYFTNSFAPKSRAVILKLTY